MDITNHIVNHAKSVKFNNILHDTMDELKKVTHSQSTAHSNMSSSNSSSSINGRNSNVNDTIDGRQRRPNEVNNNENCNEHNSSQSQKNANEKNPNIQPLFDQNCAKTNGYVTEHSKHKHCTTVQHFQNYHKPNR